MRLFSTLYLLLLCYVIAALVFWGLSLQKQSGTIFHQERLLLQSVVDSASQPLWYMERLHELEDKKDRRTSQYIGEGSTFLLIIFIGAAVVYSSLRRSIRLSRQQNNFMLAVTHELKSPIAAMKLNLQTLERHQNLDEQKKEMLITRCIKESDRLNDLCNNMLLASQIEGKQYVPATEKIDFAELANDSLKDYMVRYPGRFEEGVFADTAMLTGDRLLLHMAVNNLLENAVKYTPADKKVIVSLTNEHNTAVFSVKDNGPGVPENEKRKIFKKFYRLGNEETRKSKGTGLGLYLTDKIVRQHKGRIAIKDNTPSGAVFEITLPLLG
jgi:Osmosensitive K+ channel histidine kinase